MDITLIPGIMRGMGWRVSAALMESWFRRGANAQAALGVPDTTTVRMDWVLGFPRAAAVYQDMVSSTWSAVASGARRRGGAESEISFAVKAS